MPTIKIGNKTITFRKTWGERDSSYHKTVDGITLNLDGMAFYFEPQFLVHMEKYTFGCVRDWVLKNEEEITEATKLVGSAYFVHYKHMFTWFKNMPESLYDTEIVNVEFTEDSSTPQSILFQPEVVDVDEEGIYTHCRHAGSSLWTDSSYASDRYSSSVGTLILERPRLSLTRSTPQVMNYTHRPVYTFYSKKKERSECYFGLELEVNSKIPWSDLHKVMTEVHPVQENFMFAKSDASISGRFNESYELVTHPMTPRRMRHEFSVFFNKLEALLLEKGLKFDQVFDMETSSTGIHIHASKTGFSPVSISHIKKFQMVWNNPSKRVHKFISKLAQRDVSKNTYTKPSVNYQGRTTAWCLSKGDTNGDRYVCSNVTAQTVEVRAFRGVPSLNSVLHAVDTVEAMINYTEQAPYSDFNMHLESNFRNWLNTTNRNSFRTLKKTLSKENKVCA